jgi:hypothetical protein
MTTTMAAQMAFPRPTSPALSTTTSVRSRAAKREGNIADSFASLSGKKAEALPDYYRQLKLQLVAGNEDKIVASWKRLLAVLKAENAEIAAKGPAIIPRVPFSDLEEGLAKHGDEIRKRGAAVIQGVVPEDEARAYKFEIEEYVRQNPQTTGEITMRTTQLLVPIGNIASYPEKGGTRRKRTQVNKNASNN